MRKNLVSVLLVLVMVFTAVCGSAGATATANLAKQIEGTWELTNISGIAGLDESSLAEVIQLVQMFGGSLAFTFHNGTMRMDFAVLGMGQSTDAQYTINGSQLVFDDGGKMDVLVEGNTMMLGENDMTMILTKVGGSEVSADEPAESPTAAPAEESAKPESGLIGEWKVIAVKATGETASLANSLKKYFDGGMVFRMTFTEDSVTISMDGTDELNDKAPYKTDGDKLYIGETIEATYQLLDEMLIVTQGEDVIGLEYAGEAPAANPLTGTWEVAYVGGEGTVAQQMQMMLNNGATLTYIFNEETVTVIAGISGQTSENTFAYTKNGNTISLDGDDATYSIEEDTLILNENGMTMTMVRK